MSGPIPDTLIGIDFGTVRIGVALSRPGTGMATAIENYTRRTEALDIQFFQQLVREESASRFIVGLPIHLNGGESQKSLEARQFGRWLEEHTGVPVTFFDERFTSYEAEQLLNQAQLTRKQRRARLDKLAAQIMLTAYLEASERDPRPSQGLDD